MALQIKGVIALKRIPTKLPTSLPSSNGTPINAHSKANKCPTFMLSPNYLKPKTNKLFSNKNHLYSMD
jgi:hypothetical protein